MKEPIESATSSTTMYMWILFVQLKYVQTAVSPSLLSTHFFHLEERFNRQRKGVGLGQWVTLTQANENGRKKRRATKKKKKGFTKNWRETKALVSSAGNTVAEAVVFHWSLGKSWCTHLSLELETTCHHMITTPRYSKAEGNWLLPSVWTGKHGLSASFSKHAANSCMWIKLFSTAKYLTLTASCLKCTLSFFILKHHFCVCFAYTLKLPVFNGHAPL